MKKIIVLALAILLCFTGCGKNNNKEVKEDDGIKIGFTFDNFVVERWQRDRDVFVSTARELGAEVNVQNANGNVEEQIKQIQYFIEKNMDVIVVVPIEAKSLQSVISEAKAKGIRIVSYDRLMIDTDIDLYISFDNEAVGNLMGEAVCSQLNKGDNVIMVCGAKEDSNVTYIENGFKNKMQEKGINILDIAYMDNWSAELAEKYMSENMNKVLMTQGIMCGNDDLAREVIRALAEKQLAGKIVVVGQDADLEACQRIVAGTQYMTVYKPIEELAKVAAEAAVNLAKGIIPSTSDVIAGTNYTVPFLKLKPIAVTKENMDETVIASGFHLREDVYIDRPSL